MNRPMLDHYRCPESLGAFQLVGRLSEDPGYFSFGTGTVCYGNSASGSRTKHVTDPLYDALGDVRVDGDLIQLRFDPNEVTENLRYERYLQHATEHRTLLGAHTLVGRVYYSLRPFLPVAVRKHLQRVHLRDWKTVPFDYSIDLWKQQLDAIRGQYGLATFIVHPDYVIEKRARRTYQKLLEYLVELRNRRNTWIALPREVDRWWRTRSLLTLVHDGQKWRIEGSGKERARLAFATLTDDTLTLTVEDSN
jgi:hypothetical protein